MPSQLTHATRDAGAACVQALSGMVSRANEVSAASRKQDEQDEHDGQDRQDGSPSHAAEPA